MANKLSRVIYNINKNYGYESLEKLTCELGDIDEKASTAKQAKYISAPLK